MLPRWTLGILALALAFPPHPLHAQRRGPGPAAMPTDSLISLYVSRLNLTDEQTFDIQAILESHVDEATAMVEDARAEGPEAMQELRSRLSQLRAEASEEVEAVLTDEQIREYRKIQAEIQQQMRARMRDRRPPPPPGR